MATTIITDSQPTRMFQYGLRLPDGTEHWAPGALHVGETVVPLTHWGNFNHLSGNDQPDTFKDVYLNQLAAALPEPGDVQYSGQRSMKSDQVKHFYSRVDKLAQQAGVKVEEYVAGIRVISRQVVVIIEDTTEAPIPPRGWEVQEQERKVRWEEQVDRKANEEEVAGTGPYAATDPWNGQGE